MSKNHLTNVHQDKPMSNKKAHKKLFFSTMLPPWAETRSVFLYKISSFSASASHFAFFFPLFLFFLSPKHIFFHFATISINLFYENTGLHVLSSDETWRCFTLVLRKALMTIAPKRCFVHGIANGMDDAPHLPNPMIQPSLNKLPPSQKHLHPLDLFLNKNIIYYVL